VTSLLDDRRVRAALAITATLAAWMIAARMLPNGLPAGVVLLGAVFGSLYGLIAIGIVLIYQANRVVNFAQAELGAVAAVLAIELRIQYELNYFVAVAVGLIAAFLLGGLIDLLIMRWFRQAPRLILAVATIGVAQVLNGFAIQIPLWFTGGASGFQAKPFSTPWKMKVSIAPVIFHGDHIFAMIVVPAVLIGLVAFLRFTDYGVAIRAAADNGDRANLLGIPVRRLSTIVWAVAGLLSAVAVILRVPLVGFVSFTSVSGGGLSLLLRTLAAAVIGRMENLTVTALAAVGLGVFEQAAFFSTGNANYADAMLVGVILIALLAQRGALTRMAETGISTWRSLREVRPVPRELRHVPEVRIGFTAARLLLLAFALALPLWAHPAQEELAALVMIYAILAVSLVVLTGWAGQISLGHFALAGFGGALTSTLLDRHGVDVFLAIPAGMLLAGAAALLIGLPALRIRGPFLAVTTLAFAVTSANYFLEGRRFPWFINDNRITRPALWHRITINEDWQMYYVCLVTLVLVIVAVQSLRASRTGRAIVAARDNEWNTQAIGANTVRLKLTAFVVSGMLAGLAGGLYVLHQHGFNTNAFGPEVSIRLFSMVVIGGLGSIPGAIVGAMYVRGAEYFLPKGWTLIASGTGLLFLLILLPGGLGEAFYRVRDNILRRIAARHGIVVPSLVADVLVERDDAPPPIDEALERLRTEAVPDAAELEVVT
jgi:branched-chain amino acid transport system permease protein